MGRPIEIIVIALARNNGLKRGAGGSDGKSKRERE